MSEKTQSEELSLSEATSRLVDECRMVLPGIQALFGFQLIAVFSDRFSNVLSHNQQRLHVAAIALVALAVALIMTPAAYHRQTSPRRATAAFITVSTRLLLLSMIPLGLAICIDFYLVAGTIISARVSLIGAIALGVVFSLLWFALPRVSRGHK